MATPIFLDLDGLLLRSYSITEATDRLLDADGTARLFNGLIARKRPHVEEFLEEAAGVGTLYLFTAAQPGYARSALKAFNLAHRFTKLFSGVYHSRGTVANELRLYGRPWLLLDDSPPDHETVVHKLGALGAPEPPFEPAFLERHFLQVPSFLPHIQEDDDALVAAATQVRERVKSLERRMIRL